MNAGGKGNILVMQSGGCTGVLNRSLLGIVREAIATQAFGEIYGAVHGVEGFLTGEATGAGKLPRSFNPVNLGKISKAAWNRIARAPGAALGSTRHKPSPEQIPVILDALSAWKIRYLLVIGGNDSADTSHRLSVASRAAAYQLAVINVPKTIDNDLVGTDHSPGYGSAARFVALAAMGAGRDAEAMGRSSPITIIEVMGRDAGWLAAAAALARQDERDAPHLIFVPEIRLDLNQFLDQMETAYRRFGFVVAVISENVRGPDGILGGQEDPTYVDGFGHPYFEGPARYLSGLVSNRLNVRARYEKPGTIQRSFMTCVSRTDAQEAEMAGAAAVRYALDGHTDQMVGLVREPGDGYRCTTCLVPLEQVAGKVKRMPDRFLSPSESFVTPEFIKYVLPLIGSPLPRLARLL